MSRARVDRGMSVPYPAPAVGPAYGQLANAMSLGQATQAQRLQTQVNEAFGRVADTICMNGQAVFGLPDVSQPGGITDGISFTNGQSRDVPHNLGREATGFVVIDCRGYPHSLVRATQTDPLLKKTHIKLSNDASAVGTCTVKLWVF